MLSPVQLPGSKQDKMPPVKYLRTAKLICVPNHPLPQSGPPPSHPKLVDSPFPALTILCLPFFPGSPLTDSLPQCFATNSFKHPTKL